MKKGIWIIVGIVVAVIVLIASSFMVTNNKVVTFEEQISESESAMDVALKKRHDLVIGLVDAIQDAKTYEQETLTMIVEARNSANKGDYESAEKTIDFLVEAYPELKAMDLYKDYTQSITQVENNLSSSRDNFNHQVKQYNRYVRSFPAKMVLGIMGYEPMDVEYLEFNESNDFPIEDAFGSKK